MKQKQFYDEAHARDYLIGSIIRFEEKPIYILDIQSVERSIRKFKMIYSQVGFPDHSILFLPDKKINMEPVPLGMMDTDEDTWYVQRKPSRSYKVGLSQSNISYQIISGQKVRRNSNRPNLEFNSHYLNDCIIGKYPSYNKALRKILEGDRASMAFSRRFAVNRGGLVFKSIDDTVGICERARPILFDHFQYLKEVLEEDMDK